MLPQFGFARGPRSLRLATTLGALGVLAACASAGRSAAPAPARADLIGTDGSSVGSATFRMVDAALQVDLTMRGLSEGPHGVHLHAVGKCEGPTFTSAGGHVNPAGAMHGAKNPAGPHAGDLPNAMGGNTTRYTARTLRMRLEGTAASLFDADGTAIVVHAAADDEVTDPTGNSGARVACGVIVRG